jgi:hypothetical protein
MDVQMVHGLPGSLPVINPDIETVRGSFAYQKLPHLIQQLQQRRLFCWSDRKIRTDMPFGDNQTVAGRNRVAVVNGHRLIILKNNPGTVQVAEWANHLLIPHSYIKMIDKGCEIMHFREIFYLISCIYLGPTPETTPSEQEIILLDIGSHDEVYR